MPRRLVLLALAIIAILVLANQGSHNATTNGPASPGTTIKPAEASPSTTIKPAEAKIGIAVQRGPVCLGDMEAQEYFVRVRVVNTGNVKEVIHLVAQPGFSIKSEWVVMGEGFPLNPQESKVVRGSLSLPTGVQPGLIDGQILVSASASSGTSPDAAHVRTAIVIMRGRVGPGVPPC